MVEFTNEPVSTGVCLARTCSKCKHLKWRVQYLNSTAKRCIACTDKLRRSAKCKNCGKPTGLYRNQHPRKYCKRTECQEARLATLIASGAQAVKRLNPPNRKKLCPACGKHKPLTEEHFTANQRNPDGTVKAFYGYCKPCAAADRRDRYATDPEYRAKHEARRKRDNAKRAERRRTDPEFDAEYRAYRLAHNALYRQRRKARRQEVDKQAMQPNVGREMIVAPLMRTIEVWREREGLNEEEAAGRLGITPRRFWDWRHPGAKTRMSIVDRCLLGLDMLWWEIWPPVEYPEVAKIWEGA